MTKAGRHEPKICAFCARAFEWRKKWERCWDEVRFCSDSCRRKSKDGRLADMDAALRSTMTSMLDARGQKSSLCPSEVARAMWPDDERWREHMEDVRRVARRLVAERRAVILQKGRIVDPSTARGAIRIRRR